VTEYLYVRNWRKFQHYKGRSPPWIKLHMELLTSLDWLTLSDTSRLDLIVIVMASSRFDGKIPADPQIIKRITGLRRKPNLKPLIECGFLSKTQADASAAQADASKTQADASALPQNAPQRRGEDNFNSEDNLNLAHPKNEMNGSPLAPDAWVEIQRAAKKATARTERCWLKLSDSRVPRAQLWWRENYGSELPVQFRGKTEGYLVPWEAVR
jgi:hypothetical protein